MVYCMMYAYIFETSLNSGFEAAWSYLYWIWLLLTMTVDGSDASTHSSEYRQSHEKHNSHWFVYTVRIKDGM